MRKHVTALMLAALTTACVNVYVNKSLLPAAGSHPPVPGPEVDVYFEGDLLPHHERIAILFVEAKDRWTIQAKMIDKLREEAGNLGANAIVLRGLEGPSAKEKVAAKLFDGIVTRKGQALAIRVTENAPTSGVPDDHK